MGLAVGVGTAQTGIRNHGVMRLHEGGSMGVHGNFSNDGSFEKNAGLVGFYSDSDALTIGGSSPMEFYDMEVAASGGIILENSVAVTNNTNLIVGDIRTDRETAPGSWILFSDNSFYTGESPTSKVDGYAAMQNKQEFTFPVGDSDQLHTLHIESQGINPISICAYVPENPGSAVGSLDSQSSGARMKVSSREYWSLQGELPSRVTLSWSSSSNIQSLVRDPERLRVLGWSKNARQWVDLGNTEVSGDRDSGMVRSDYFVPGEYEMLTLGSPGGNVEDFEVLSLDNYFLSPNGDGRNDRLEIDGVTESPNNRLEILDRNGMLVYQKDNYSNEFEGIPNTGQIVEGGGLDEGVYFYIITFYDLQQRHQGYFYLNR